MTRWTDDPWDDEDTGVLPKKLYGDRAIAQCLDLLAELESRDALLYCSLLVDRGVARIRMDVVRREWDRVKHRWPEDR